MDFKPLLEEIKIRAASEFDKNFRRKAFFEKKWKPRKRDSRGSLMYVTGRLSRSIRGVVNDRSVSFTSSTPYASIHNAGGTINVTPKITIPQRQFIGHHKTIEKQIEKSIHNHIPQEIINHINFK